MAEFFRRWRPRHLFAGWVAYWAALVGVTLGPAVIAAWPIVNGPHGKGSVNAGFQDGVLKLTVLNGTTTIWSGATTMATAALWLAVPPLLMWLAWALMRPLPDTTGSLGADASAYDPQAEISRIAGAPGAPGAPGASAHEHALGAPNPFDEPRPAPPRPVDRARNVDNRR